MYTGLEYGNLKKACRLTRPKRRLRNLCRWGETVFKLVIVEDEDNIRHSLECFIPWDKIGFQVVGAFSDGSDALDYLRDNPCDAVLTDILMSRMSGLEMIQHLHQIHPSLKVIILSGHSDFGYAQQAIRYQVAHYLVKPVDEEELISVFQSLRAQLDSEAKDHTLAESETRELKHMVQKNFFRDLLSGAISTEQELEEYLKLLGLEEYRQNSGLVAFEIKAEGLAASAYTSAAAPETYFGAPDAEVRSFCYESKPGVWQAVFFGADSDTLAKYGNEKLQRVLDELNYNAACVLTGHLTHSVLRLTDLLVPLTDQLASEGQMEPLAPVDYKLLIVELDLGSEETLLRLLNRTVRQLGDISVGELETWLKRLYSAVEQDYKKRKMDLQKITNGSFRSNRLFRNTDRETLLACATEDFCTLCRCLQNRPRRSEHSVIDRIVQHLDSHPEEDIGHEAIAAKYRLHPGYLSRLFKQEMGETLSEYLLRTKVERAAKLLKEDRYKIGEIATMVGYSTSSYFSVMFKKYTGCSPREYCQRVSL